MTIENVLDNGRRTQYIAAVSQTAFDYPFSIFDEDDLVVVVDGVPQVITTDYTVDGVGDDNGGTVTLLSALAGGEIVTIYSDTVLERTADYGQNGPLTSRAINDDFDRLFVIAQELKVATQRSLRIPVTAQVDDADIELEPANYAGKYLSFDSNGKPTPAELTISGVITQEIIGTALYPRTAAEIAAGVTPVNYYYPELVPNRYLTNSTPGTTDMTAAVQAALDVAAAKSGGQVRLLPQVYLCTANLNVNVGHGETVDLIGSGWSNGGILFSGAAVTTGVTYAGSALEYAGSVEHLWIKCQSGAKRCITFSNVNHPRVVRCHLQAAAGAGVMFDDTLMGLLSHTLLTGCGSATEGSVEVEGTTGTSTTWRWEHSRISGGTVTVGGLIINRTTIVDIDGGAIESCGPPIKICTKADASGNLYRGFHIQNIDLENPGANPYIDIGSGLSGGGLVLNVKIESVDASPSGTTTVPYFVRVANLVGLHCSDNHFTLGSAPTSCHELTGTNISGVRVDPHRNLSSLAVPWMRYNGAQVLSWSSHLDCRLGRITSGGGSVPVCTHKGLDGLYTGVTLTGATPSILIDATQGGFYASIDISNGGLTTITSLSGGEIGMEITLLSTNANTTLTFGNNGGAFRTTSGANLTMAAAYPYRFYNDGANNAAGGSCWVQIR